MKVGKALGNVAAIGAAALTAHAIVRRKWLAKDAMKRTERKKLGKGSSLREPGRRVFVVTTASLPWMTGTAVNPLLRVAYLSRSSEMFVTLVIPWLQEEDQRKIYPDGMVFSTSEEQEKFVRQWVADRVDFEPQFGIIFYPGHYDNAFKSIIPSGTGDITKHIPHSEADVAVLEEPEHLNWFNSGRRWIDTFCHVVGICHTNYVAYARQEAGETEAKLLEKVNEWNVQMHCHKVIKLSDAVQPLPRSVTCFVHGVSGKFLAVGDKAAAAEDRAAFFSGGAYFIGKAIWGKGYWELLQNLSQHKASGVTPSPLNIDVFGSGDDLEAIKAEAKRVSLSSSCTFHGSRDHLHPDLQKYRCFINPSLSDVVATTSAEALAMGKWIVVADHPENEFFRPFHNCLFYDSPQSFSTCVARAMTELPAPLTPEERESLTWEAATERFLEVAEIGEGQWPNTRLSDAVGGLTYSLSLEMLKTFKRGLKIGGNMARGMRKVMSRDKLSKMQAADKHGAKAATPAADGCLGSTEEEEAEAAVIAVAT